MRSASVIGLLRVKAELDDIIRQFLALWAK